MEAVIAALEEGDVVTAADEYAWAINEYFEWYEMYFSPEVMEIHYDMFYGEDNQDNLFWGTGKSFVPAKVSRPPVHCLNDMKKRAEISLRKSRFTESNRRTESCS